jgi:Rps23 Pro-64 3,4-dihydroxylase Tpa1-like proline 4-hydroxylase
MRSASDDLASAGWCLVDQLVGPGGLARAAAEAAEVDLRPAGVGGGADVRRQIRGDEMTWLTEPKPGLRAVLSAIDDQARELAADACLALGERQVQLARYPAGASYARHFDTPAATLGPRRRLTCVYYLNQDWHSDDGGALRLWPSDTAVDVAPVGDRLVVFFSERLAHEVLPSRRPRTALTAWYYGP